MDIFDNILLGFSVAITLKNLSYCLLGSLVGTLVGVLPGLGPVATIAMLMPLTYGLDTTTALIMLAGIYYGAQYGGSTTAVLVNIPGETSSIITTFDGHQMALQGRAAEALLVAALGSFFAGTVSTFLVAGFAPPLSMLAINFSAPEYFSLMVLCLIGLVVLAHGSVLKAIAMVLAGLLLGLVGQDVTSGVNRLTFGIRELSDGIGFVVVAMALFGINEIIVGLESPEERREVLSKKRGGLGKWSLSKEDFRLAWPASVRGTALGAVLGLLPGSGGVLASFVSYIVEKKIAKDPSRFGKGAIEGVAGPESANNAGAQTSFIPMLTLGLPSTPTMALMIGALTLHGIQPGPQVMTTNPTLFWGLIASMWIGNLFLVILNLPLIGVWIKLVSVRFRLLYPAILLFCCIGVYSLSNSTFEVILTSLFCVLGYCLVKLDCEPAPLLLGMILGPMMEENLRRAMTISRGDPGVFIRRPVSLVLLIFAAALLLMLVVPAIRKKRVEAFKE
ncbi:MAG: tripartite tricarboxylate transporter permease [Deltaproteobacteria bacterium]|nr:tripartite tricarboxylate transporter permease [Deltaproteobacteria bacterium]